MAVQNLDDCPVVRYPLAATAQTCHQKSRLCPMLQCALISSAVDFMGSYDAEICSGDLTYYIYDLSACRN